jgi:hypothetical protein
VQPQDQRAKFEKWPQVFEPLALRALWIGFARIAAFTGLSAAHENCKRVDHARQHHATAGRAFRNFLAFLALATRAVRPSGRHRIRHHTLQLLHTSALAAYNIALVLSFALSGFFITELAPVTVSCLLSTPV